MVREAVSESLNSGNGIRWLVMWELNRILNSGGDGGYAGFRSLSAPTAYEYLPTRFIHNGSNHVMRLTWYF